MAPTEYAMTEKELAGHIVKAAKEMGWLVGRTWLSKFSPAGEPDLRMVKAHPDGTATLAYVELKSTKGKLTEAQEIWLAALRKVPGIDVFVWRPDDLERAYAYLVNPRPLRRP